MSSFQRIGNTAILNANATLAYTQVYSTNRTFLISNESANTAFFSISGDAAVPSVNSLTKLQALTTTANANASTVTVTYSSQSNVPFAVGSTVQLSGYTPGTYNGNVTVVSANLTAVKVTSLATGAVSVQGNVSQPILNGTSVTPILGGQSLVYTATTPIGQPKVLSISAITASGNAKLYITPGTGS